ncbi:MAG: hypothetical protein QM679_05520, partial [Patulibacter sp.]
GSDSPVALGGWVVAGANTCAPATPAPETPGVEIRATNSVRTWTVGDHRERRVPATDRMRTE